MKDLELLSFIDAIYREPYSLLKNNCIHKSLKIRNRARERGKQVDIIVCISVVTMKWLHGLPVPNPHMYTLIDGVKVDVSLDPGHELRYCRNQEKKLVFPVNVSRISRLIRRRPEQCETERQSDQDGN